MESENDGLCAVIEDLETEIEALNRRVDVLEKTMAEMVVLGREFWRGEAAELLVGASITSWHYDVRQDNVLFADVARCDVFDGIYAKRWVGKSGQLFATLSINRAAPLQFSASILEFAAPELEDTLALEIDGEPVTWSARDGRHLTADIPERPGHARLQFRLSVDRNLIPKGEESSFSFSDLRIEPLPCWPEHNRFGADREAGIRAMRR
jgi:hypothetical protein